MNPGKSSRRRSSRRRGSTILLFAFLALIIAGMLAFAIDTGYMTLLRTRLQNAADAAALAGAQALAESATAAISSAETFGEANHVVGSDFKMVPDEDIQVGYWDDNARTFTPLTIKPSGANAVRVTCRLSQSRGNSARLFFGQLFGRAAIDLQATATAQGVISRCGLIVGLEKVSMSGSSWTDSFDSDMGPYTAASAEDKGHVCSNGDINMSGSTAIRGNAHPGPGKQVKSSSSIGVIGRESPLAYPITVPAIDSGSAAVNNDNASIPQTDNGKNAMNGQELKLSGGDHVQIPPGTYYFSKMSLTGGSTISIVGPTVIYVEKEVSLSGGSMLNYTSLPKNLQLYGMGDRVVLSGGSEFFGVVYAPGARVERSGSSDFYGSIVGKEIKLTGDGGIHADEALETLDSTGMLHPVLVE